MQWSHSQVAELRQRAATAQHTAGELCAQARSLTRRPPRRRQGENWMRRDHRAEPGAVPLARLAVARFAARAGADADQLEQICLAVSEAVAQAVVRAEPEGAGQVQLEATVAGGELAVLVLDDCIDWGAAVAAGERGWWWQVIVGCTDAATVSERATGGTRVEMRWRLTRLAPPQVPASESAAAPA